MAASIVFLTPLGGLAALAAVAPLAGAVVAARRVRRARTLLGLAAAPSGRRLPRLLALAAVPALLGLAATQPAVRSATSARVRTDAQAFFVIDVSRSMRASKGPGAPTRFARAVKDAIALRAAIPTIPSGIATLTDRVLPSLLPNPDERVFDDTITHAVSLEQPPPASENVIATSLAALGALGTQNYFPPAAKRRLVVVLTDGESRAFDAGPVARALASGPGVRLVLVHVWATGEGVYVGGRLEPGYREDPASQQALAALADASGGAWFGEQSLGSAIRAERADLGTGPTIAQGRSERVRTLAPYLVLLSFLPLLAVLGRAGVRGAGAAFGVGRNRARTARAPEPRP
jgi:hypothetical protein